MSQNKDRNFIPDNIFTKILDNVPICTVDVVFLNPKKTKTLLFLRNNEPLRKIYFSVGGRLLKNELLLDGAVRLVKDEIGLDIDSSKLNYGGIQEEIHPNSAFPDVTYHAVTIYYYYVLDTNKVIPLLDKQHRDYKWFDISDPYIHSFIKDRLRNVI